MVGNRAPKAARARWRPATGSRRPAPRIRSAMARLTTSRGASSSTKRSPLASRSNAPWPRSASESSGRGIAGWCSAVGWNCMNSTSATGTPARRAMARPSAGGLGRVGRHREELARASGGQHGVGGPHLDAPGRRRSRATTPTAPSALDDQIEGEPLARAPPRRVARVASTSARSTSAPVAAPPAWTTRAVECPPSRARASAAARLRGRRRRPWRSARGPGTGPRRRAPAPRRCRTARPRRPGCRPGGDRSSPRRRRARRRRRPAPIGSPTGRARPWSARRPGARRAGSGSSGRRQRSGQADRRRQARDPAPEHEDVESPVGIPGPAPVRRPRARRPRHHGRQPPGVEIVDQAHGADVGGDEQPERARRWHEVPTGSRSSAWTTAA